MPWMIRRTPVISNQIQAVCGKAEPDYRLSIPPFTGWRSPMPAGWGERRLSAWRRTGAVKSATTVTTHRDQA